MTKRYDRPLSAQELASRPEAEIDMSDIPELDDAFWARAEVEAPKAKANISLRVEQDVMEFFRAESPKGYTSRMAAILGRLRPRPAGQVAKTDGAWPLIKHRLSRGRFDGMLFGIHAKPGLDSIVEARLGS